MTWASIGMAVWKFSKTRPALVIAAVVGTLWFGGIWAKSRQPVSITVAPTPSVAESAPEAEDWPEATIPCPEPGIPVLTPTGREREAVAEEFDAPEILEPAEPDPGAPENATPAYQEEIVSLLKIPKMPEGGKALLTTSRKTGGIKTKWFPNPWEERVQEPVEPKAVELLGQWGLGLLGGTDDYEGWEWSKVESWNGYAFVEPLRTGHIHWRAVVGRQQIFGQQGNYVMVGAEWRRR